LTARVGTNAELIRDAAELYLEPGWTVADVTYGQGVFWKYVDTAQYNFLPTDLATDGVDFKALPYETSSIDALAFDPPYRPTHDGSLIPEFQDYGLAQAPRSTICVHALYAGGLCEASRVMKKGGVALVKCQDGVASSKRRWTHVSVMQIAETLGFEAEDLMVLVQAGMPVQKPKVQVQARARANHSYLWVFRRKGGLW
jgi:hypothetical protein